jgi:hypothetical protein
MYPMNRSVASVIAGSVLNLVLADGDQVTRLASAPGYGLSSSTYARDPAEAIRFRSFRLTD